MNPASSRGRVTRYQRGAVRTTVVPGAALTVVPLAIWAAAGTTLPLSAIAARPGIKRVRIVNTPCFVRAGGPHENAQLIRAILAGEAIQVFNNGQMARDFTYIDDIVAGIIGAVDRPSRPGEHRIYNLGNHRPERLLDFIAALERVLGQTARKQLLPMQPGDVEESYADIDTACRDLGFEPHTTIEQGIAAFVDWYKDYHK